MVLLVLHAVAFLKVAMQEAIAAKMLLPKIAQMPALFTARKIAAVVLSVTISLIVRKVNSFYKIKTAV